MGAAATQRHAEFRIGCLCADRNYVQCHTRPYSASPGCKGAAAPRPLYVSFRRYALSRGTLQRPWRTHACPADQRRGEPARQRRRVGVPHPRWASRNASRSPVRLVPVQALRPTATWADHRPRLGSRRPRKLCRGPSACNGPIAAHSLLRRWMGSSSAHSCDLRIGSGCGPLQRPPRRPLTAKQQPIEVGFAL